MSLFKVIPNTAKVIDKFGMKVFIFKTVAAAIVFADSNGETYNPLDIESIADATNEDRIAAGFDPIPDAFTPEKVPLDLSMEKVKIRMVTFKVSSEVEKKDPGAYVAPIKPD